MKNFIYICILFISFLSLEVNSQCSFKYISNDTVYQDYFEFIYARKNADEIITIGSRFNRTTVTDSTYNAPVFQIFDYCGNIIHKMIYYYIGNFRLKHERLPIHQTYLDEMIGNKSISIQDDEFLIVDKAFDTLMKKQVLILFRINGTGELTNYRTLNITNQEANNNQIRNVLKLKNGNILVVCGNNSSSYIFYYFNENSDFLFNKYFSLDRGLRAIKEIDNGEFICTSMTYDKSSFQFYRINSNGEIKWITTPYEVFGSARDILINDKIYITGSTQTFGVILVCDFNGNILKEFKYDTIFCNMRFCSTYLNPDSTYIIGGYIQHCDSSDIRGTDIALIVIDSSGTILWNKTYDFRNALGNGNSSDNGYFTDYGGFSISKTNDGSILTNGLSKYSATIPGTSLHEDALLIKTEPMWITNVINKPSNLKLHFELQSNILNNKLILMGPIDKINNWMITDQLGIQQQSGKSWSKQVNVTSFLPGNYILSINDSFHNQYSFKFIKL